MNGKVDWMVNGRRVNAPKQLSTPVSYYLRNEEAILAASGKSIGCMHGFRKAAKFSSKAELDSLRFGEDAIGLAALRFNGAHPRYRNGGGRARPFRLVNGRPVRVSRRASK